MTREEQNHKDTMALIEARQMFRMKQDEWIETCKEVDRLKQAVSEAKEIFLSLRMPTGRDVKIADWLSRHGGGDE